MSRTPNQGLPTFGAAPVKATGAVDGAGFPLPKPDIITPPRPSDVAVGAAATGIVVDAPTAKPPLAMDMMVPSAVIAVPPAVKVMLPAATALAPIGVKV